jgi:hypothetical protein
MNGIVQTLINMSAGFVAIFIDPITWLLAFISIAIVKPTLKILHVLPKDQWRYMIFPQIFFSALVLIIMVIGIRWMLDMSDILQYTIVGKITYGLTLVFMVIVGNWIIEFFAFRSHHEKPEHKSKYGKW